MHCKFCQALVLLWIGTVGLNALGQETVTESPDETARIREGIQSYVAAFNARDAEKLARHWSPDGVYTSRTSGEQIVGREAMTEEFKSMFASGSVPKLAVATESVEFISPNVALERGTATVTHAQDELVESDYRVVYLKIDGAWLIDRVTEEEVVIELSHYEQLQELEWLIGDWVEEDEGLRVEISCQWTSQQNFISRSFKVYGEDELESSGLQIIGWDAKENTIRSWLFDSDGGFVSGTWVPREDRWVVQSVATLADGGSGSYTSIFRPLDDGQYEWRKINRVLNGRLLPNVDEIIFTRQ